MLHVDADSDNGGGAPHRAMAECQDVQTDDNGRGIKTRRQDVGGGLSAECVDDRPDDRPSQQQKGDLPVDRSTLHVSARRAGEDASWSGPYVRR